MKPSSPRQIAFLVKWLDFPLADAQSLSSSEAHALIAAKTREWDANPRPRKQWKRRDPTPNIPPTITTLDDLSAYIRELEGQEEEGWDENVDK